MIVYNKIYEKLFQWKKDDDLGPFRFWGFSVSMEIKGWISKKVRCSFWMIYGRVFTMILRMNVFFYLACVERIWRIASANDPFTHCVDIGMKLNPNNVGSNPMQLDRSQWCWIQTNATRSIPMMLDPIPWCLDSIPSLYMYTYIYIYIYIYIY